MSTSLVVVLIVVAIAVAAFVALRKGALRTGPAAARAPTSGRIEALRRSLMTKAMGDASKVDAWVQYERARDPSLTDEQCYARANERWERDNR